MRIGVRLLASVLILTMYLPVATAQATSGDTLAITGLSGPETVGVVDASVTVTAMLSGGGVDTTYTGTIHIDSSDPAASLPADLIFLGSEGGQPDL